MREETRKAAIQVRTEEEKDSVIETLIELYKIRNQEMMQTTGGVHSETRRKRGMTPASTAVLGVVVLF